MRFRREYGHVFVRRDRYIIAFIFILEAILIVIDYFKFHAVPELSFLRMGMRALYMVPLVIAFFYYFTDHGDGYSKGVQGIILIGMAIHNLLIATYHHPYLIANMTPGFLLAVYIFTITAYYTFLSAWLSGTLLVSALFGIQYVLLRGWFDSFDLDQVYAPFLLFGLIGFCHYTAVSQGRQHRLIWWAAVQERKQKQHAEEVQAFRKRLLELVGHDLRQPLGALRYQIAALRIGVGGQESIEAKRTLLVAEQVSRAVDQITEMLDAALALAQLDNQDVEARCRQQTIAPLVQHLQEYFATLAALTGVEIRIYGASQTLFHDPALMMPVLRNLVGNTLKYHNHDTNRPRVVVAFRGRRRIDVVDNGGGFSAATMESALPDNRQRAAGARHGIGLTIARQLALRQGWEMEIANYPGRGVCFSLRLRTDPPQSASAG